MAIVKLIPFNIKSCIQEHLQFKRQQKEEEQVRNHREEAHALLLLHFEFFSFSILMLPSFFRDSLYLPLLSS